MSTQFSYSNRKYSITDYSHAWPVAFEHFALQIRSVIGPVRIEHIGSTAVAGMSGKNTLDLLVIVDDLALIEARKNELEQVGFSDAGQLLSEESRLFRVMNNNELIANIHFFVNGHPHIDSMLQVRNYLNTHPEERKTYSALKQNLYARYPNDYASYRKEKDDYMKGLLLKAGQVKADNSIVV